jgi:hypothetical protein
VRESPVWDGEHGFKEEKDIWLKWEGKRERLPAFHNVYFYRKNFVSSNDATAQHQAGPRR